MKISYSIGLFFILTLFVVDSFAVEVTLLGPKQFMRQRGKPFVVTMTFPGCIGSGTIHITNGTLAGTNRVSRAVINVNGQEICGANDFNLEVSQSLLPINLKEQNTLSVNLSSEVGSYLWIQINQEVAAVGAAVIGPQGGHIEIMDPSSQLASFEIQIPSGTLEEKTIVSLREWPNIPDPPPYVDATSTSFKLFPDGLTLNEGNPVQLIIPFEFDNLELDDFVYLMSYDHSNSVWEDVGRYWIDTEQKIMGVILTHFSDFAVMLSRPNVQESVYVGFKFSRDRFPISQVATKTCKGISAYTKWYFDRSNIFTSNYGLTCAYSQSRSEIIRSRAQNTLWDKYLWWGPNDDDYVANKLLLGLKNSGKPQLLNMAQEGFLGFQSGTHMVLVYKYEYDFNENKGYFYIHDSNVLEPDRKIEYQPGTPGNLNTYFYYDEEFSFYRFESWAADTNPSMEEIYSNLPQEHLDFDGDGIGFSDLRNRQCDNCPEDFNPNQAYGMGDVNGDLKITPKDAQLAFNIYLGIYSNPTFRQLGSADANCDGTVIRPRITPADAQAIFDKYLGLSELPCDCSASSRPPSFRGTQSFISKDFEIGNFVTEDNNEIVVPIFCRKS